MTVDEFNNRYDISAYVTGFQSGELHPSGEVRYGHAENIEAINYTVYDLANDEEVFTYTSPDEAGFLKALKERFGITNLTID